MYGYQSVYMCAIMGLVVLCTSVAGVWSGSARLAAAVAGMVVSAVYYYGTSFHRQLDHIPGPTPHLFVGHFPEYVQLGLPEFFRSVFKQYGKTQQIATKFFKVFHNRPQPFRPRKSHGLVNACDQQWKRLRSAMVPTFSDANLKSFQPAMNAAIDRFLANLDAHCQRSPTEPIDMFQWWSGMTMEVIGATAFGTHFSTQDTTRTEQHPITTAANLIFAFTRPSKNVAQFILNSFPFLKPAVMVLARKQVDEIVGAFNTLDHTSLTITEQRRADPAMPSYKDFVSLLLQAKDPAGNPLTNDEIRDQENTFLLAGYETTANSLSYACFLLSHHPTVMDKLLAEIDSLAPNGHLPIFEELSQFRYLEQVLNESSRLYPVAMMVRETTESCELGGYHIPSGTIVYCPAFVLHYDPASYANPMQFDPDRWSESSEENRKRHKYAHIPFGAGPRMCIGYRFATEELKLALIRVLQRFTFTLHARTAMPLEVEHGITLSAKHGIHLTVHKRP